MAIKDKIILLRNPLNGSVAMMRVIESEFQKINSKYGVTEDQFIQAQIDEKLSQPQYAGFTYFIKDKSDVKKELDKDQNRKIEKLRCDGSGKLSMDLAFKTKDELQKEQRDSIKTKLKNGTPLTDEEADILLGK